MKFKPPWIKLLTAETEFGLKEVGRLIAEARKRRAISLVEIASRIGADRRTVGQLEKGNPKVSLGIFFQVLSVLNLLRGIEEIVRPENDLESISNSIRKIRRRQAPSKKIGDEKVNF